jgi:hypothetical protein
METYAQDDMYSHGEISMPLGYVTDTPLLFFFFLAG